MQYLLLIYANTSTFEELTPEDYAAMDAEYTAVTQLPSVLGDNRLQPGATATTVRVADGRTLTTDGPFIETKEELGGYYLIEAEDLDGAIEIASRIPATRHGAVEIRPVWER